MERANLLIVAMTRPRRHLCICGDSETISRYVIVHRLTSWHFSLEEIVNVPIEAARFFSGGWSSWKNMQTCDILMLANICNLDDADRARRPMTKFPFTLFL